MARQRTRRGVLPAASEAAFQQAVINYAQYNGWRCYHPPDNRPSANTGRVQAVAPGYPDLTMVRAPLLVFAELKAQTGRLGPGQAEWFEELNAVGLTTNVRAFIWRPSDWPEIEAVLTR